MKRINGLKREKRTVRVVATAMALCSVACLWTGCNDGEKQGIGASYPPLVISTNVPGESLRPTLEAGATQAAEATQTPPSEMPVIDNNDYTFSGKAYCIADASTGAILMSENADTQTYIASITKLLTALTALDYFTPEDRITAKDEWLALMRKDKDIDGYGIKGGETYSVDDYLKMLIIKSYGDAALVLQYATAEAAGKDFIALMNEKAASFGMEDSHFDNPIGLDIGNNFTENYSTAADVVKLTAEAYKNETLFAVCCMRKGILENGKVLKSTVPIYGEAYINDSFAVLGGKTGSTEASGVSFACVGADSDTEYKYIIVYLNGKSSTKMYDEISAMFAEIC